MTRVIRSRRAEQDLHEVGFYIGVKEDCPDVAERLLRKLAAKCELYAGNPDLGAARLDLGEKVRVSFQTMGRHLRTRR